MTNPTNTPQYIPLPKKSQCSNSNILFYDCKAPTTDILECATTRLYRASELNNIFNGFQNPSPIQIKTILTASNLLMSDAVCMIDYVQSNVNKP